MGDIPPRYTADLEDTLAAGLAVPPTPTTDQQSVSSRSTRRWDDPPEEDPDHPPENMTTMVFIKTFTVLVRPYLDSEILSLTFTPNETHIAGMTAKFTNTRAAISANERTLVVWSATNGQRVPMSAISNNRYGLRVEHGCAFKPGTADMTVACPFSTHVNETSNDVVHRLEVYSLLRRERTVKVDLPVRAPIAWSPDGSFLVGVSSRDPSRIVTVAVGKATARLEAVIPRHMDEVTQLAFLPPGSAAGAGHGPAVVSAGKDGYVRVTALESRRTLMKIEIGARAPASMMQVSADGKLVVTVWGRDVVLWYLDSGRVHNYNLNAVRQTEGWPMCVSPDCRYLACRTEDGFDVSDVLTGKFRGEFPWSGSFLSSAVFTSNGSRLVLGDYSGGMHMFEVVTP